MGGNHPLKSNTEMVVPDKLLLVLAVVVVSAAVGRIGCLHHDHPFFFARDFWMLALQIATAEIFDLP
jgi:hypothetical protein